MTTPVPANAVPLSAATGIMLIDGTWVNLTQGSLMAELSPVFIDPQTGQLIAPGDTWFQFTDDQGQVYAAPLRSISAVKLAAPVQ